MRLVVDCRYVRIGHHDGISRFTAGIVGELGQRHPLTMLISDHRQLDKLPALPWQLVSSPTSPREPWVARQVRKLRPDVVFSPMQTMGSWGRDYGCCSPCTTSSTTRTARRRATCRRFVRGLWRLYHLAWWPQRMLLNRADAVVTVSETSAGLIREHQLTDRPVTVVHNAADELGTPDLPRAPATGKRPRLHGLVHAVQERRHARARRRDAARPRAAPDEPHQPRGARGLTRLARRRGSSSTTAPPTPSTPRCSRAPPRWCTASKAEGSASRSSRPCGSARRSSSATSRSSARSAATPPCTSTPATPRRSSPRCGRSNAPGSGSGAPRHPSIVAARYNWAPSAEQLLELMRRTVAPGTRRRRGAGRRR